MAKHGRKPGKYPPVACVWKLSQVKIQPSDQLLWVLRRGDFSGKFVAIGVGSGCQFEPHKDSPGGLVYFASHLSAQLVSALAVLSHFAGTAPDHCPRPRPTIYPWHSMTILASNFPGYHHPPCFHHALLKFSMSPSPMVPWPCSHPRHLRHGPGDFAAQTRPDPDPNRRRWGSQPPGVTTPWSCGWGDFAHQNTLPGFTFLDVSLTPPNIGRIGFDMALIHPQLMLYPVTPYHLGSSSYRKTPHWFRVADFKSF